MHAPGARPCDWVPGCYYLMPREVVDRIGLFDPRYFLYYEEVDHCRAVKASGWDVVCLGDTSVVHVGGESAKSDARLTQAGRQISSLQLESELLYFRKQHGWAGVAAHLALCVLGDGYLAIKDLVKRRGLVVAAAQFQHSAMVWRLLHATDGALRPTR
jgi:N-acetylglucosaminyl-diphospho-decaprenol L-rhamnosyltransferase